MKKVKFGLSRTKESTIVEFFWALIFLIILLSMLKSKYFDHFFCLC